MIRSLIVAGIAVVVLSGCEDRVIWDSNGQINESTQNREVWNTNGQMDSGDRKVWENREGEEVVK